MEEYRLLHGDCENNETIIGYAYSLESVKSQLIDFIHTSNSNDYNKEYAIVSLINNNIPIKGIDNITTELYFGVSDYVTVEKS